MGPSPIRSLLTRLAHRGNLLTALCSAGIIAVVSGCATTETTEPLQQPRRFTTTVSSSSGLFVPTKQQPVLWDGTIAITDSARRLTADREQQIMSALKQELQQRGITFTATPGSARFAMKAALLVGTDVDSAQLNNLCGVAPELKSREGVELAAMGICFTEIDTQQVVWKSATEVVIRSQGTEMEQIERVQRTVRDMLAALPAAR